MDFKVLEAFTSQIKAICLNYRYFGSFQPSLLRTSSWIYQQLFLLLSCSSLQRMKSDQFLPKICPIRPYLCDCLMQQPRYLSFIICWRLLVKGSNIYVDWKWTKTRFRFEFKSEHLLKAWTWFLVFPFSGCKM